MEYRLRKGEVVSMPAAGAAGFISVREGQVWLTRSGDPRDHLLAPGDHFPLGDGGTLVLEALTDATIGFKGIPMEEAPCRACAQILLRLVPQESQRVERSAGAGTRGNISAGDTELKTSYVIQGKEW